MKRKQLFAALLCAVAPFTHAENGSLDEVVVTASRSALPLQQTLQHTTVITRADIEASGAQDVATLLRNRAGIEITQTGGMGTASSLYLRGSNSTHTLVLLDGVRIGSATTGSTAIEHLTLDNIERIEIVRGNVSSLYGSEAIGGVVQLFTRKGNGTTVTQVAVGHGTHDSGKLAASLTGASGGFDYALAASDFHTAGVSAINPALAAAANPDADGYSNRSASLRLGYAFAPGHRIEFSAFDAQGRLAYDESFGAATDTHFADARLGKTALALQNQLAEGWQSRITLGQGTDDSTNYKNNLPNGRYKTTSDQLGWQNTVASGERGVLVFGAERLRQQVASDTAFSVKARTADSLFAGYTAEYGAQQVQVNLRGDRYSDFGSATSGLLGYGLRVSDAVRLTATLSTAFKAPTFNDMYYPLSFGYQGNPNLKPERARSIEAGLHWTRDGAHFDATLFANRVRDLIVINNTFTTMENLDEALIEGAELAYGVRQGDIEVENALTVQTPRNAKTGALLKHRAQMLNTLTVARRFEGGRWAFEWRASGARDSTDINTFAATTLPAYDVINLTAQWQLAPQVALNARVDNLFGQDDMLVHGYNTPGRTVSLGLAARY